MEPYKKSVFAAPKSLRSQELSRKKPLTQDGLIVEVKQKVRFLGIDCCLNGPLVALPSIPIADVPFNSLQKTRKTIYQVHRQTS